jgi:hypothetical protein
MFIPENVKLWADQQAAERLSSVEDEAKHHAVSPENIAALERYRLCFDAAVEAHAMGKAASQREAIMPLLEIAGLVQVPNLHRDFLTGDNT